MHWTSNRPNMPGFYYWRDNYLRSISPMAVRVVQVAAYKNRDGFRCHTLTPVDDASPPVFDCDIGKEPAGWWAGPLPNPGE